VLGYHRIGDGSGSPYDRALWSATAEEFDLQIEFLARNFEIVGPEDLATPARSSRRRALITFDDGYRDNYELALPVLRRHGARATFFLATGFLDTPRAPWWDEIAWMARTSTRDQIPAGIWLPESVPLEKQDRSGAIDVLLNVYKRLSGEATSEFLDFLGAASGSGRLAPEDGPPFMTWQMARELCEAGMSIGGHTHSHPVLARLPPALQQQEIEKCVVRIREELGVVARYFSYPVGLPDSFDTETRRILREQGVELAFSLYGGYRSRRMTDPYDIPRTTVAAARDQAFFRAQATLPQLFSRW
jgi:peptidoglycan/xylan/chitin deacetylase (PgdA/CDA1 family)